MLDTRNVSAAVTRRESLLTSRVEIRHDCVPFIIYPSGGGMKILARLIKRRIRSHAKSGHCAIYEYQLQRLWPIDEVNRKQKIAQFADENGLKLSYYRRGLCAIFEPKSPHSS